MCCCGEETEARFPEGQGEGETTDRLTEASVLRVGRNVSGHVSSFHHGAGKALYQVTFKLRSE